MMRLRNTAFSYRYQYCSNKSWAFLLSLHLGTAAIMTRILTLLATSIVQTWVSISSGGLRLLWLGYSHFWPLVGVPVLFRHELSISSIITLVNCGNYDQDSHTFASWNDLIISFIITLGNCCYYDWDTHTFSHQKFSDELSISVLITLGNCRYYDRDTHQFSHHYCSDMSWAFLFSLHGGTFAIIVTTIAEAFVSAIYNKSKFKISYPAWVWIAPQWSYIKGFGTGAVL
jgi:hypothetical protein